MIKSFEEFEIFYDDVDKHGFIQGEKLIIDSLALDFFVVGRFKQQTYVSAELKTAFDAAGISGVIYIPDNSIEFRG